MEKVVTANVFDWSKYILHVPPHINFVKSTYIMPLNVFKKTRRKETTTNGTQRQNGRSICLSSHSALAFSYDVKRHATSRAQPRLVSHSFPCDSIHFDLNYCRAQYLTYASDGDGILHFKENMPELPKHFGITLPPLHTSYYLYWIERPFYVSSFLLMRHIVDRGREQGFQLIIERAACLGAWYFAGQNKKKVCAERVKLLYHSYPKRKYGVDIGREHC